MAQLASASVWHTEGQGFESPQVHFCFRFFKLLKLKLLKRKLPHQPQAHLKIKNWEALGPIGKRYTAAFA